MQVQDDVKERMQLLAACQGQQQRSIDNRIELTSREPSSDIPSHLERMAVAHPNPEALDVILATNMISVGVDIDRLGLMAVMGQPQSTSEYIQATSRVGRKFPGLVVDLLNASRSRDRSHYESFVGYHSALYRQVESTSVTPFSPRARDRGLHAVLVALARHTVPDLLPNDGAGRVADYLDRLEDIKAAILSRVNDIRPEDSTATASQIDEIIRQWCSRAEADPDLVFSNPRHPDKALLADASDSTVEPDESLPTPWSLRDVDAAANLYQVL